MPRQLVLAPLLLCCCAQAPASEVPLRVAVAPLGRVLYSFAAPPLLLGEAQHGQISVQGNDLLYTQTRVAADVLPTSLGTLHVEPGPLGVHGDLTYAFVPTARRAGVPYLDHAAETARPIRGARLQLVDASDRVVAQSLSDAQGAYAFAAAAGAGLRLRVLAQSLTPPVEVVDNVERDALFAMQSAPLDAAATLRLDLRAASGWDGDRYAAPRTAAPFAILDTAVGAGMAFAAARPLCLAPLRVHWSERNVPQKGLRARGHIGTSHWNGDALFVLGHADIDTDEYDSAVLLHEWAHYFEATQSRSDSLGGPHSPGAVLDMRLAFSEGLGNALGSLLLAPRTWYADTLGPAQAQGFSFDLLPRPWDDGGMGFASERVVHSLLFDAFGQRPAAPAGAGLQLGLGALFDVLHGAHARSPAVTSLFSFVAGLKATEPQTAPAVDQLVADYGMAAIDDAFGGGPRPVPIYTALSAGAPGIARLAEARLALPGAAPTGQRFVRIRGTGAQLTAWVDCPDEVALHLYGPRGAPDGAATSYGHLRSASRRLGPWQTYLGVDYTLNINLRGAAASAEDSACVLRLQPS